MQEVIVGILSITKHDISIKATTTEKWVFAGREEGLKAYATVLLENRLIPDDTSSFHFPVMLFMPGCLSPA